MQQQEPTLNSFHYFAIGLELAYLALPLLIYIVFFLVVAPGDEWTRLIHKPEWMFIALIFVAESMRDSVNLYSGTKSGPLQAALILNLLLLVLSAVVLCAVLGAYEGVFPQSRHLQYAQWLCLGLAITSCAMHKGYKLLEELPPQQ